LLPTRKFHTGKGTGRLLITNTGKYATLNKMAVNSSRIYRFLSPWLCAGAVLVFFTSFFAALPNPAHAAKNIAIVSIDEEPTTIRTIKGIKKALDRSGFQVTYMEAVLTGHTEDDARIMSDLRKFAPTLFVTISSYATHVIAGEFPDRPIIFANVMNPKAGGFVRSMDHPGGRITGAALDIPADLQFKYFQRVVGKINTMGVIYSSETENIIRQAEAAASARGIDLISLKIESEKEIPRAIDSLCKVSEALWSVADHTVYTPQSTKHIVLQTLRNRIPMMGFSQALVEAGGLFTLDFDFKNIGEQAGEIASRVLFGADPGQIPVSTPGVIYFKYNEKTAEQISIKIPDDLLAVAKEVIK
jgi:putative ABC transport system substrate-binding protein